MEDARIPVHEEIPLVGDFHSTCPDNSFGQVKNPIWQVLKLLLVNEIGQISQAKCIVLVICIEI